MDSVSPENKPYKGTIMSPILSATSEDPAARQLGLEIQEVRPGYAKATLKIQDNHINALGAAHGGVVFLLADTVFEYACNSREAQTVASNCAITYHLPSYVGDCLTAIVEEKYLAGRNGIYDGVIQNQDGKTVAHFRGNSIALRRP